MAESNIVGAGYPQDTAPVGSGALYQLKTPATVPTDSHLLLGDLNLLPNGYMINGYISVTVASNNLTAALKTLAGTNPSATDPVSIWHNGSFRRVVAPLSVTINAGADSFLSGSRFPTKERDYFAYLIWNTTPATDIADLGISPLPYGTVWSQFSTTAATQNYMPHANASTPAATDDVCVIGRFAATLSAGAGYTWSVPTFTNTNLLQRPTNKTRWLSYAPSITGFSSAPANAIYEYQITDTDVVVRLHEGTAGTSNATGFTYSAPMTAKTVTDGLWATYFLGKDNGSFLATPSYASIATGGATITCYKDGTSAAASWTGSSTKQCYYMELRYPLA